MHDRFPVFLSVDCVLSASFLSGRGGVLVAARAFPVVVLAYGSKKHNFFIVGGAGDGGRASFVAVLPFIFDPSRYVASIAELSVLAVVLREWLLVASNLPPSPPPSLPPPLVELRVTLLCMSSYLYFPRISAAQVTLR